MGLIFHPAAAEDAKGISFGYAATSAGLAARFWNELESAIDVIAEYPEGHPYDPSGFRRANLKKFPFHILFEKQLDCVRVMVVRHDHRDPAFGLDRR